MVFRPSLQQTTIFHEITNGSGNLLIEAVAGAGKTTTLIHLMQLTQGTVGFFSFAKRIVDEIVSKVSALQDAGLNDRATIKTMHGVGWQAVRGIYGRAKIEGRGWKEKKLYIIAEKLNIPEDHRKFASAAVSKAKNIGMGVIHPFSDRQAWLDMVDHFDLTDNLPEDGGISLHEALRSACLMLRESNAMAREIVDFDDMIYLPALLGLKMPQFDWILNDEAQDTNAMRLALVRMMLKPGGRMVSVGDSAQAIFGFTGADSDALNRIKAEFNCKEFPLTVSYRCPQAVVAEAQRFVDHIQAAPDAPMGKVVEIGEAVFLADLVPSLTASDVILCRNTKPLVSLAYALLGRGIGCRIEGKDIGTGLKNLATKWKRIRTVATLRNKLVSYCESETAKALAKGHEYKAESVSDKVECLLVIMAQLHDDDKVESIVAKIDSMFGDTPAGEMPKVCTLSTIHKSKGREWPRVFWYGRNEFQPSKYARQDWQMIQERNLSYVAATRAQEELYIINTATKTRESV